MFRKSALVFLIVLSVCRDSAQFIAGAPVTRCLNLLPGHGDAVSQEFPSPYGIVTSKQAIGNGQKITVEIKSLDQGRPLVGFVIQARTSSDPVIIDGRFLQTDENLANPIFRLIDCLSPNTSATHSINNRKERIILEWEAPRGFTGVLRFHATIVESFSVFWVNQMSEEIEIVFAETETTDQPLTQPPETDPGFYEGCDETKTCFGIGDTNCVQNRRCNTIGAVIFDDGKFYFEMRSSSQANYVAFALSDDRLMGQDSVIECVNDGGTVRAFTSFTTQDDSPRNQNQTIIRLIESRFIDGMIYCKVEREPITTIGEVMFDLIEDKHYLMLVSGTAFSQNMVGFHDIDFEATADALLLSEVSVVEGRSRTMLYLHASFMIVAWIGTTSIGIFTAKFMKRTWTNVKVFGKDFWFVTHQITMIITWLLTLAGFIIILVDSARWSTNAHSVLGTIAFVLCIIQPFGAFFRPGPKHSVRPIFNFFHSGMGKLAQLLTIIAMFYATTLIRAQLPRYFIFILIGGVVVYIVFYILMTILNFFSVMSENDNMSDSGVALTKGSIVDAPYSPARKIAFILFTVLMMAFVIALVLITVLDTRLETR